MYHLRREWAARNVKAKALQLVAAFDEFGKRNDPFAEHDFGSFELVNRTFFWKIDYCDAQCEFGSDDPSEADHARAHTDALQRVLIEQEVTASHLDAAGRCSSRESTVAGTIGSPAGLHVQLGARSVRIGLFRPR